MKKPNIVMVLADEQHLQTVGCYGDGQVKTPNVDRLAEEGMKFDSAYCCSAICSPSRAALFTGKLPHRFGSVRNDLSIPKGTRNLAQVLSEQGYNLGYAGKWHVDKQTLPTDHGFEGRNHPGYGYPYAQLQVLAGDLSMPKNRNEYYNYLEEKGFGVPGLSNVVPSYSRKDNKVGVPALQAKLEAPVEASIPGYVGEETVQSIRSLSERRKKDGKPFFTWANFWGPHNPCFVPEPYYSMYDPKSIPMPPSYEETFEGKPGYHEFMSDFWGMKEAPWSFWQDHLAAFYGYCTLIDDQVGRMIDELKAQGEWENTIFVYTVDHGDMLGRHRILDKGPMNYDEIYRIPMVACGPGIQRGNNDEFVYLHDWFSTIGEMAGGEVPKGDGQSLMPLLSGTDGWQSRDDVYGEFDAQICSCNMRMIRTRTHKFVFNGGVKNELYDLVKDPGEMVNLVDDPDYKDVKVDLIHRLIEHAKATQDRAMTRLAATLRAGA